MQFTQKIIQTAQVLNKQKRMQYTGGHKAGVLNSSFVAEVKSDLMGEQTILCGILQTGSILCFR
jgi:ketol-acid reductoisomerase